MSPDERNSVWKAECGVESVGSLTATGAKFQIIVEQLAVNRVRAVVDDLMGAFNRVKTAEVGNTLIGHNDIYRVFGMVYV